MTQEQTASPEITRVGVVGAGVIGASWTAFYLAQGLEVVVTDPAPEAEQRLGAELTRVLGEAGFADAAGRVRFDADLEAVVDGVQLVQENGPERLDVKRDLFARMDAVLPAEVLLASSSSGLQMSQIQTACSRYPERCLIAHPFNPPHLVPLVELVGGAATTPDMIARARGFYDGLGKVTIVLTKEMTGHVANRLAAALFREVYHLVGEGVVSVADADRAVAWGPGLRWGLMGQLLTYHLGGGEGGIEHFLDHLGGPITTWWDDLGTPSFSPEVDRQLADQLGELQTDRTISELAAERDRLLAELVALRRQSFLP